MYVIATANKQLLSRGDANKRDGLPMVQPLFGACNIYKNDYPAAMLVLILSPRTVPNMSVRCVSACVWYLCVRRGSKIFLVVSNW